LGSKERSWIHVTTRRGGVGGGGQKRRRWFLKGVRSKVIGKYLTVAFPHKQALNNSLNCAWRPTSSRWFADDCCCCLVSRCKIKQRLETALHEERKLDSFWCSNGSKFLQCSCWLKSPCNRWYLLRLTWIQSISPLHIHQESLIHSQSLTSSIL
jgi:hypothetical protein